MLRQTSDWEGTLWGKPDWADRPEPNAAQWTTRPRHKPGTVYKYNDVRVNALALAALNVWRRPLPQVLKETIMDPIGASDTWRWFGYENRGWCSTATLCSRSPAAAIGAAPCSSTPPTRAGYAISHFPPANG